jgi:hypothetical protein
VINIKADIKGNISSSFMIMNAKQNCESIGKSHDYEAIGIQHIGPYNNDLVITLMPKAAFVRYSAVTYECKQCGYTRDLYLPREIAEEEMQSQQEGRVGITKF